MSFQTHSFARARAASESDSMAAVAAEDAQVSHIMLVFAGRRPSAKTLLGLCNIASINGARFTVARVWTIFSRFALLIGGSMARTDLALISEITRQRGITCDTVTWRSRTYPAGIIQLTHQFTPDMICIVPAAIGNGRAIRRAIGIAGQAVEGRLVIDQLPYGK